MTCRKCGELLDDNVKFCTACGAKQETSTPIESALNPVHNHEEHCAHEAHVVGSAEPVGFLEAVKLFFLRYADFRGRSRRSEYWFGSLGVGILGTVFGALLPDLVWIWSLIIWLPTLCINIRRLHDIGKSGWWYLVNLIPLAGPIIFLVWTCKDSTEDNIWGPNPKN